MTTTIAALNSGYWDAGYMSVLGRGAGAIVLYAVVGLVLMMIGFYAIDLTTPGPLRNMVDAGKPNAIIVAAAGNGCGYRSALLRPAPDHVVATRGEGLARMLA